MKKLYINEIKDVTSYGNSCPIIVKADDNNTYVLNEKPYRWRVSTTI